MQFLFCYTCLFSCLFFCHAALLKVVILNQNVPLEDEAAKALEVRLRRDRTTSDDTLQISVSLLHRDFHDVLGGWAIWPLFRKLEVATRKNEWVMFCESFTKVDVERLIPFLDSKNPNELVYYGFGLVDTEPVIIHHFYGYDSAEKLKYPDFGAGVIFSRALLQRLIEKSFVEKNVPNFAIDPKFELAKMVLEFTGVRLTTDAGICLGWEKECFTWYQPPTLAENSTTCDRGLSHDNVFFAVKTFSGFHKTRVVVVKRTWAKDAKFVEFFSNLDDYYVPTVDLGVPNTERGHCGKTMAILKHALAHEELSDVKWFVVADDDTLLSVPRLYRLLNCLPRNRKLIVGERYGYGFTFDGTGGYDYPTGGASMIFTRSALRHLVSFCECPANDSPDDMILGMCARRLSLPMFHSAAFHQARNIDYSSEYLTRQPAISFHKFEQIDPYEVYATRLHERDDRLEREKQARWSAQHKQAEERAAHRTEL